MTGPECYDAGGDYAGEGTSCGDELPTTISVTVTADPDAFLAPDGTGIYNGQTQVTVEVCNVGDAATDVITLTHNTLGDLHGRGTCTRRAY